MFTSLWVAYPLYEAAMNGDNSAGWKKDPNIPDQYEINLESKSYQVNYGSTTPDGYTDSQEYYARGHQIPNADRKGDATMNSQTYYQTNSTPQIQNGFNGGIWSSLENSVRKAVPSNDTLYVVTGAAFQKIGEPEKDITWILPKGEIDKGTNKKCPVPNYYWKVLMKVKRDANKKVVSASTIGFWFVHEPHTGTSFTNYSATVKEIEQWTGFDFFVNLPDDVEETAENNKDWNTFYNFKI